MKRTVLFCTGVSGSGKTFFIKNMLPFGFFYNLKSATTRPMRGYESEGREYYFRDEKYFETENFATYLFVNEAIWKPGDTKWLYGVPEFEIKNHWGKNLVYDVIEPKYVKQLMLWFDKNDEQHMYNFRVLWFLPPANSGEIIKSRQNMPNDCMIRTQNTCNQNDFDKAGVKIDHIVVCNPQIQAYDSRLGDFLDSFKQKIK